MVILVTLTHSIGMIVGAEGYINDIGHRDYKRRFISDRMNIFIISHNELWRKGDTYKYIDNCYIKGQWIWEVH